MIDFKKLSDPEWIAKAATQRAVEDRDAEMRRNLTAAAIQRCQDGERLLQPNERAFIDSCARQFQMNAQFLSDKQIKWLGDIENFVDGRRGIIAVSHGMRGYFAVHMSTSEDSDGCFWPQHSGIGSHRKPEEAAIEAREWAESEGLRFESPNADPTVPVLLKQWIEQREKSRTAAQASTTDDGSSQAADQGATTQGAGVRAIQEARARARTDPTSAKVPVAAAPAAEATPPASVNVPLVSAQPVIAANPPTRHFRRRSGP